jgi:hypothetical protein
MTVRPILFTTQMVQAVLDKRKTQTRRPLKIEDPRHHRIDFENGIVKESTQIAGCWHVVKKHKCPFGKVGGALWVRETWKPYWDDELFMTVKYKADDALSKPEIACNDDGHKFASMFEHESELDNDNSKWRPNIHMFRWAARMWLPVINIRIERVQDISEADAKAEGVALSCGEMSSDYPNYKRTFHKLWDSLYGKKAGQSWDDNPWVWVADFKVVKK